MYKIMILRKYEISLYMLAEVQILRKLIRIYLSSQLFGNQDKIYTCPRSILPRLNTRNQDSCTAQSNKNQIPVEVMIMPKLIDQAKKFRIVIQSRINIFHHPPTRLKRHFSFVTVSITRMIISQKRSNEMYKYVNLKERKVIKLFLFFFFL